MDIESKSDSFSRDAAEHLGGEQVTVNKADVDCRSVQTEDSHREKAEDAWRQYLRRTAENEFGRYSKELLLACAATVGLCAHLLTGLDSMGRWPRVVLVSSMILFGCAVAIMIVSHKASGEIHLRQLKQFERSGYASELRPVDRDRVSVLNQRSWRLFVWGLACASVGLLLHSIVD